MKFNCPKCGSDNVYREVMVDDDIYWCEECGYGSSDRIEFLV